MKKRPRKPRPQRIVTPDTSTLHPIKLPPIAMVEAPMPEPIHYEAPKEGRIMRWLGIILGCN